MIRQTFTADWSQSCELAARLVQDCPTGPLEFDLIVVPGAAHHRSLSQYLAARAGGPQVAAGLDIITPATLERRLLGDRWRGEALTLAICEVLADPAQAANLAPVLRHLGAPGSRPGRRWATSARLARLLRRYGTDAPQLVAAWRDGADIDTAAQPLADRQRWQPALWRALRQLHGPDLAELAAQQLALLEQGPAQDLPQRIIVLAIDDPTPARARLLTALGSHHEVQLITVAGISIDDSRPGSPFARHHASRQPAPQPIARPAASTARRLLHQLQDELRADRPPVTRTGADDSVQIHACHGPDRQVEVLRDILCGLFSDDPTLQPRDVVVLCTSPAEYAPLIEAAFCLSPDSETELHPGHRLRVQLAAGMVAAVNPVLTVLTRIFELHAGRATSVDLIDFCQLPPVAHRFGFTADDLDRAHELVAAAQIRWGIDADQRRRAGLAITQSTWLAGVQRLLLSLTLTDAAPVALGTSTPLAQVQGSDANLIGRLSELVSRVRKVTQEFCEPAPAPIWAARLRSAVELLISVDFDDSWQLTAALADIADLAADGSGCTAELAAADLACWLAGRQHHTARPNYGNGSLLVTGLDDLATINAKVICVLGLDDAHFPGAADNDGDDLLGLPGQIAALHWTRDRRAVRRQRLLDAILAAGERFIVITQGADECTGEIRPAPVCIADLLEACAVPGEAGRWRATGPDSLVSWHPLHPHGWPAFIVSGQLKPASFDQQGLQGALALAEANPLPNPPHWQLHHYSPVNDTVDIDQLLNFYLNPARELLRQAAGTSRSTFERQLQTELPIEPDQLNSWAVGNELFQAMIAGADPVQARTSTWLSGRLLPGRLGERILDAQLDSAQRVATAVRQVRTGVPMLIDCRVELADHLLAGRVPLWDGQVVVQRFGHPKPDDALACWLRLLLVAADPANQLSQPTGLIIGKTCWQLRAPAPDQAQRLLAELVSVRADGLVQVSPLPLRTAAAYADLMTWQTGEPLARARTAYGAEDANWHYFFGNFDELVGAQPGRFEQLASWLLGPIVGQLSRWRPGQEPSW